VAHQIVNATRFKADCATLLSELKHGGSVTITKRGVAVASLDPPLKPKRRSSEGRWAALFPDMPEMNPQDYDMAWDPTF